VLNQETIVAACIHALNLVSAEPWVSSFKKVNLHPHHRVDFTDWCKRIENKLKMGEQFFKNMVGLWDAMPAFWKTMPPEHRQAVVAMINRFYEKSQVEGELIQYVAMDNIEQLRGCYLTTKIDPSVMIASHKLILELKPIDCF
jgi:hypothetical protein